MGWCAQEDALFEFLTVREHIELFDDLLGIYDTVLSDTLSNTAASIDIVSIEENEKCNQRMKEKCERGDESGVEKESEESYVKEEAFFSKRLNRLVSYFTGFRCDTSVDKAQTLVLTRLGMVEHSNKMACELSGKRTD